MIAVGMGKIDGATVVHRSGWKYGFDTTIRALAAKALASGKILCGVAVVENALHQICLLEVLRPEEIDPREQEILKRARALMPRIPFAKLHLLIVEEMGKNISGAGMDTHVIGRGVKLQPGEAPTISLIYVRDLTPETAGNATGVGLANLIHERLYRQIDLQKTHINLRTSMNLPLANVPIHLPSDREALDLAWGYLGSPDPGEQQVVWIRNTQNLGRMAISERLAGEAAGLKGWRLAPESFVAQFDSEGNLASLAALASRPPYLAFHR